MIKEHQDLEKRGTNGMHGNGRGLVQLLLDASPSTFVLHREEGNVRHL